MVCCGQSKRRRGWFRAFTLIELLVVISIIALLVAILLPSLGEAKATAIDLKCLTNMRQLGVGYHQYQTDFKQLAGIHEQAFVYANSWGLPNDYRRGNGGMQLWNSYSGDPGYAAANTGPEWLAKQGGYGYMGIGYVALYNGTFGPNNRDLRIFRCPTVPTEQQAGVMPSASWGLARDRFFERVPYGGRILSTYWYRGGAYYKDGALPDSDPNWTAPYASATSNWSPHGTIIRPDSPYIHDRNYLTCYSYGYVLPPNGPFPNDVPPTTAAHRMKLTNLAKNDGSAKSWNIRGLTAQNGHPIRNVFGWYDGVTFNAASFYDPGSPHNSQLPYWWVRADRGE